VRCPSRQYSRDGDCEHDQHKCQPKRFSRSPGSSACCTQSERCCLSETSSMASECFAIVIPFPRLPTKPGPHHQTGRQAGHLQDAEASALDVRAQIRHVFRCWPSLGPRSALRSAQACRCIALDTEQLPNLQTESRCVCVWRGWYSKTCSFQCFALVRALACG
jgi:hypothetical protein